MVAPLRKRLLSYIISVIFAAQFICILSGVKNYRYFFIFGADTIQDGRTSSKMLIVIYYSIATYIDTAEITHLL